MLRIGDIIFSLDILERTFKCNLEECHGHCCRYGDAGAPLSDTEVKLIGNIYNKVKPFLRAEGISSIEESGTSVIDSDNETVTPLIDDLDCAYSVLDQGILMCGFEKAYMAGIISFKKPLSCHLFPLRVKKYPDFTAVNYQELAICSGGRKKGKNDGIYIYEFLKEPLIRAFGIEVYNGLCLAAEQLRKRL